MCSNGIPEEKFETTPLLLSKTKHTHFLYLSNLYKSKGVHTLLKALEILNNQFKDFRCSIVGGEGDISAQELNNLIKGMSLEKEVIYLGKRFGEEKTQVYKSADVFVFPTHYETFGLVNVEAMMYGLPVISTREGAIEDIVVDGETGLLVKRKDYNDLLKNNFLSTNQNRFTKWEKSSRKVFKKFTLTTFENKLLNILFELTKQKPDEKYS